MPIPAPDAPSLAACLRGQPGLVCFDDATGTGRWGGERVAARPDRVVRGTWPVDCPPEPADGEFWAGAIDYEGGWTFLRFPGGWHRPAPGHPWSAFGDFPAPPRFPAPAFAGSLGPDCLPAVESWSPGLGRAAFTRMVRRAMAYIEAGDIYQVNLSHRFQARWASAPDPWELFSRLRRVSPAPHAAFLDLGDQVVLSASPETFFHRSGDDVITRPIKGTRPRGGDPVSDAALQAELLASPKEQAELIMITDLERNDLGRVARTGSVRVDGLCALESFPQVHHLVSTVSARLRPGTSWPEIWQAMFPGGSITGAPKKRSMEIIRELENVPRGLYTGAIGWMDGPRHACFSIAIRTAILRGREMVFHAGSGIVEGSDPDAEFEETHHKAAGLARAFGLPVGCPPAGL